MALSGDLDVLPLLDTLHVLARHRRSGRLALRTDVAVVTITFDRGTVQSVSSSDGSLRIGQVLLDQGYVTEEQIEQALTLQRVARDPNRIGDVLVDVGYVTPTEISRAVAAQLEASLVNVLIQERGTFEYHPEPDLDEEMDPAPINFEPLVLNATYLADRWLADQKPTEVNSLPEDLIDPKALERLSPEERELLDALLEVYGELHRLAWQVGDAALTMKQAVERLLEHALVRIAVESHEDERLTGREDARNERIRLADDVVDPWILAELSPDAQRVVLTLLNGASNTLTLAADLEFIPEQLNQALDELTEEQLIEIDTQPAGDDTSEPSEEDGHPEQEWLLSPSTAGVGTSELQSLPRTELQVMMAVLNGSQTVQQISEDTGLPVSLLQEQTTNLVERGLLQMSRRDETGAHSAANTVSESYREPSSAQAFNGYR